MASSACLRSVISVWEPAIRYGLPSALRRAMPQLLYLVTQHRFPMWGKIEFIGSHVPVPDAIIISLDDEGKALFTFSQCTVRFCQSCRHLVELLAQLLDFITRLNYGHV